MNLSAFDQLRRIVQVDRNRRGLRSDGGPSIFDCFDLEAACESLAASRGGCAAIVTGFFVPHARPPRPETDGPPGAIKVAEVCTALGIRVLLLSDSWCRESLQFGCRLPELDAVPIVTTSRPSDPSAIEQELRKLERILAEHCISHLIAIERPGPAWYDRPAGKAAGPDLDRCFNMAGEEITEYHFPFHPLFSEIGKRSRRPVTIGIGDGGNEIGMGRVPRDILCRSIPQGEKIACRVATDFLIPAGVSNWGAYALAAALAIKAGLPCAARLFDPVTEIQRLEAWTRSGLLVDGISGTATATVDNLPAKVHAEVIAAIRDVVASCTANQPGG